MSPKTVFRGIKEYTFITFGLLMYAFSWVGIVLPAEIVGGGASGIALLIYYATGAENGGIPLAYSLFAINAILITLATFIIGFKFSTKTLFAVVMMAVCLGFLQKVLPPDVLGLGHDKLLSAILGGLVAGIGVAIVFSQGGSTGGVDIIAMIINKYRTVSYGRVIMAGDFIIVGLSYFIGNDLSTVIYSYVIVGVLGYTLDAALAGNKQSSQLMVISLKYQEIADRITNELHRGVTFLDGEGGYTHKPMKVLMVMCRKSETSEILRIAREVDTSAFITVGSVMGVYGQGFDAIKIKEKKNKSVTV